MGQIHSTYGAGVPLIVDDYFREDITTDSFDPLTTLHDSEHVHPTEMTEEHAWGLYGKNGFLVRPNADGDLFCITRRQLENAVGRNATFAQTVAALSDLEPKAFTGVENTWIECPVVKVFGPEGDGTGHYVSTATEIVVGIIL